MPRGTKKKLAPARTLRTPSRTNVALLTSPKTARTLERRYQVLEMRKYGVPMEEIAHTLQCTTGDVRKDVTEVLGQTATALRGNTEEERNLECVRLDALLQRYMPLAEMGNLAACGLVLSISDRRRKLLALDIPEVKEQSDTGIRVYVGVSIDDV